MPTIFPSLGNCKGIRVHQAHLKHANMNRFHRQKEVLWGWSLEAKQMEAKGRDIIKRACMYEAEVEVRERSVLAADSTGSRC